MAQAYLDQKEKTPCGGSVRYDVDQWDMITYTSFNDVAKSRKCRGCSWSAICTEPNREESKPEPRGVPAELLKTFEHIYYE